jgi:hypothetical protein
MFAPASDIDTLVEDMRFESHSHAPRIAAIVRERDGAAPALDRAAQRRITARRLASREGSVSGR